MCQVFHNETLCILCAICFQFEVPSKFQRIIIGPRGQNIKRIEAKTGVFNIRIVPGPREVCSIV